MKVLITADTVGGVWTYAIELMGALQPHGVRFLLATMGRKLSATQWAEVRALPHVTVAESDYPLEWMPEPWAGVAAAGAWLLALEQQFQPDIVHLNGFAHGSLPFSARTLVVGHSCVLSWWRAVKGEDAPPGEWGRYADAVRQGLHAADRIAAPTEAMLTALDTHYGPLPKERLAVLPNCRDAARFAPVGAAPREPFVFCAGRLWDEAKNVGALCTAAGLGELPWPVLVAGETVEPGRDGAPAVAPEAVRFLGPLSPAQMADTLRRAAIYALPARYEPFGLSILEAALAGCALVLGDIPSLREVWGDEGALYVAPNDTDALAAALIRLAEDGEGRARLAAQALRRARTHYTPARTARAYLDLYQTK